MSPLDKKKMLKLRNLLRTYTEGVTQTKFFEPLAATMLNDLLTSLGVSSSKLQEMFNQLLGSSDPSDTRMRPVIKLLIDELSVRGQPRPSKATLKPPKQKRNEKENLMKELKMSAEGLPAHRQVAPPDEEMNSLEALNSAQKLTSIGGFLEAMGLSPSEFLEQMQEAFGETGRSRGVTNDRLIKMIHLLKRGLSSPGQPPPSENQLLELFNKAFGSMKGSKSLIDERMRTIINVLKRGLSSSDQPTPPGATVKPSKKKSDLDADD